MYYIEVKVWNSTTKEFEWVRMRPAGTSIPYQYGDHDTAYHTLTLVTGGRAFSDNHRIVEDD
jgi:hypothetical protein